MENKISVIVPVYNTEKYLKECLDSIMNQDCNCFEIICINDGSTDNSLNIINEYVESYKNICVYTKENGGLSSARNYGLERAKGKYVFFLDSDDMLATTQDLSFMVQMMDRYALDILYFDGQSFFEDEELQKNNMGYVNAYQRKKSYGLYNGGDKLFVDWVDSDNYYVSACLQCLRREFLEQNKINFVDRLIYEDQLFTFQSMILAGKVMHENRRILNRRVRKGSIMQISPKFQNFYSMYYICQEIICFSRRRILSKEVNRKITSLLDSLRRSEMSIWKRLGLEEKEKFYELPEYEQELIERELYTIEKQSDLYCFPYHLFHKGERIVIYGAGKVGKQFYSDARRDKVVEIAGIVDKKALMMNCDNLPVSTVQSLKWISYDYILIAVENKQIAREIKEELIELGIDKEKIKWDGTVYVKNKFYEKEYEYYKFTKRLLKSNKRRIFLFMLPEHGNMGDYAISIAEQQFFEKYFAEYELVRVTTNEWIALKKILVDSIESKDILFINGGGFFGDLWNSFEICKDILGAFPENIKFLFPNTLSYSDIKNRNLISQDLKKVLEDQKTYLFLREKFSWEMCCELGFEDWCFCYPDMVFGLKFDSSHKKPNGKALLCLRSDKEKTFRDEVKVKQLLEQKNIAYDEKDIHLYKYIPENESEKYINELLHLFKEYSFILTDRLHGMLLSYVCETPCIAFDNSTHKVKNVSKWIEDEDGLEVLEYYDEDRMIKIIDRYMSGSAKYSQKDKLRKWFDELAVTIKKTWRKC